MSKFGIYSAAGVKKAEGYPTFTGTYMKAGVLDFREIDSPVPIDWAVGDYVGYELNGSVVPAYSRTGFKYVLYNMPQVKRQASNGTYGGAFVYQNVQFHDASYDFEICQFRDLVAGDNRVHFSTQPAISVFDNVAGIAERIQACLDDMFPGKWSVQVASGTEYDELMADEREFSVSGVNIRGVLDKIYEVWPEVGWIFSVNNGTCVLTIGGAWMNSPDTYVYGKGNGLTSISRTPSNLEDLANRLYVFGSNRNMLPRWYNNQDIKDADSVDIQHLMLPVGPVSGTGYQGWGKTDNKPDPAKAFIQDSDSISARGLRPKTVYFDGSGDYKEVYPSIEGMTIKNIRDAKTRYSDTSFVPASRWADNERADRVLSMNGSFDSGLSASNGRETVQSEYRNISASSSTQAQTTKFQMLLNGTNFGPAETGTLNIKLLYDLSGTVALSGIKSAQLEVEVLRGMSGPTIMRKHVDLDRSETAADTFIIGSASFSLDKANITSADLYVYAYIIVEAETSAIGETATISAAGSLSFSMERYRAKTFNITLRQIGFDISAQANLGSGKMLAMRSGACVGRTFQISSVAYNNANDTWSLEVIRSNDESLSQWFPNSSYPIRGLENAGQPNEYPGDEFVLLDIAMPALYVSVAEERLLNLAIELLGDTARELWQYTPDIDAKFMANSARSIMPGDIIAITDTDVVKGDGRLNVDSVSISEGESEIPTYKVTIRDKKKKTYSDKASVPESTSTPVTTPSQVVVPGTSTSRQESFFEEDGQGGVQLKEEYAGLRTKGYLIGASDGGPGGGGGGGGLIERLWRVGDLSDDVTDFDNAANDTFNAYTINSLHTRILALEQNPGGVSSVAGLTGDVAASDLFTALGLGTAATRSVGAIENANTGLVTGGDVYSFVNSSVATATATFRGTNTTAATEADFLTWADALPKTLNDYVFWKTTDSYGNTVFKRYKYGYDGTEAGSLAWRFEYDLNNSSFTAAQWSAINSGITATDVTTLGTLDGYFVFGVLGTEHIPELPTSKISNLDTTLTSISASITALEKMFIDDTYTVDGQTKHRIKVNSTYFEGLITTGFLIGAADGGPGGGGGGGIDLNLMWASLQNTTPDTHATDKFHKNHLPAIVAADGISAGYTLDSGNLATHLNIGISAIDMSKITGLSTALAGKADASALAGYLPLTGGTMSNTNLVTNLNADLLDGYEGSRYLRKKVLATAGPFDANDMDTDMTIYTVSDNTGTFVNMPVSNLHGGFAIMKVTHSSYGYQLAEFYGYNGLYFRNKTFSNTTGTAIWNPWRTVAFEDSTVNNATNFAGQAQSYYWHQGNLTPSNYLLKSGGTMTGYIIYPAWANNLSSIDGEERIRPFNLSNASYAPSSSIYYTGLSVETSYCGFQFAHFGADTTSLFYRSTADNKVFGSWYKVWHAGNDGAGSGLDADLLHGRADTDFFRRTELASSGQSYDANALTDSDTHYATSGDMSNVQGWSNFPVASGSGPFGLIHIKDGIYPTQIFHSYSSTDYWVRYKYYGTSSSVWSDWAKIWTSANSNSTSVPWSASSLTIGSNSHTISQNSDGYMLVSSASNKDLILSAQTIIFRYGTNRGEGIRLNGAGNVGIGTSSPGYKLDVSGRGCFGATGVGDALYIRRSATGTVAYAIGSVSDNSQVMRLINYGGSTTYITLDNYGHFGVMNTSPQYALDVSGVINASTGVRSPGYGNFAASYSSSDQRLKDDLETIRPEYAIEKLMALRPSEWVWNEKSSLAGRKGAGLVAQHVEPVLPWNLEKNGEYLSLNYDMFHPYEIGSIQFLKGETDALKDEVAELRNRVETLESENKRLKERIYA